MLSEPCNNAVDACHLATQAQEPAPSGEPASGPAKSLRTSKRTRPSVKVEPGEVIEPKHGSKRGKKEEPTRMEAPANWYEMLENIRLMRRMHPAPVDTMGCDQSLHSGALPVQQRFLVLVSLMLSSQTKDPVTWAAVQRLKANDYTEPSKFIESKEKDIEDLIHPVGFYRRKAVYLKQACRILLDKHAGDIPSSLDDLCALPGVGPKMAHLCLQEAWNVVAGIGVDTHVHRIAAWLGWVPKQGIKTPEDTRKALEQWLPREIWREINHLLVGFGQTICTPARPKCSECTNRALCPSAFKWQRAHKTGAQGVQRGSQGAPASAQAVASEAPGQQIAARESSADSGVWLAPKLELVEQEEKEQGRSVRQKRRAANEAKIAPQSARLGAKKADAAEIVAVKRQVISAPNRTPRPKRGASGKARA